MRTTDVRVTADWLGLRESADAAARSEALVDSLVALMGRQRKTSVEDTRPDGCGAPAPSPQALVIHDLGCGSGSMARWLAPRLPGPQRWILHDRDPALLAVAEVDPPRVAADGSWVTVETRRGDVTRLSSRSLTGASLMAASALLDMFTGEDVDRVVESCVRAGCPALLTLSVTGHVRFTPADSLDARLERAFNGHQRRTVAGRTLLGPGAVAVVARVFRGHGWGVHVANSAWHLDASNPALTREWLCGWAGAAVEQRPELAARAHDWLARRTADVDAILSVTVEHVDLLVVPPTSAGEL
ncbi:MULTISPECIES: class I SAM-dependent methyltransferase [unclassified Knoellia]|uniref:class I SAM-dependent methyltransferase n=1 Tax=Knoellia altitudinis TaxID=3404795 RepID=UPI00361B0BBC